MDGPLVSRYLYLASALLSPVLAFLLASTVIAQDAPRASTPVVRDAAQTGQDKKIPVEIHGFLMGDAAVRTTRERPLRGEGGDFVMGEGRLRLDISGAARSGNRYFVLKGDTLYDAIAKKLHGELRDGYAGFGGGPVDLRLGRQIITWGAGDLFFINDVFPKDWESFFSGRPMEYLKLGVDALRIRYSGSRINVEVVATPFFTPDTLPSAKRFIFFDPFAAVPGQREETPGVRAANTEIALRLYRRLAEFDISAYLYRGYWRTPGVRLDDAASPATATRFYPELAVYGLSAQRGISGGVFSLEGGYYDAREDRRGNDPTVPNSQWRLLTGYQQELSQDFTAGAQFYSELMSEYRVYLAALPPGMPRQDRFRGVVSTRLTKLLAYQTWTLSLFAAYSPTDRDHFVQPEVSHRMSDKFSVSLGSNVLGGSSETSFFGQLKKSDNVFFRARFDF
jgi:hypothetical protein